MTTKENGENPHFSFVFSFLIMFTIKEAPNQKSLLYLQGC
ncbi:hypothetical protein HMPREF0083_00580 [Aneurinibacillus aneurinilyticus ATCC 12856]|uniref:Uncharacterized protein n=1 Tax=Aneurinibacillus aneurinilyticus ATCC 12856 TaxID=649747 RepID=U1YKM7_ANEAE|nr:hypothetical protein HMPREF0083_00580 [Aneurinibacillus aneurinilyticus ATCC 12856]